MRGTVQAIDPTLRYRKRRYAYVRESMCTRVRFRRVARIDREEQREKDTTSLSRRV